MEEPTTQTADSTTIAGQAGGANTKDIWIENNAFIPEDAFTEESHKKDDLAEFMAASWHMFLMILIPLFLISMASWTNMKMSVIIGIAYLGIFACFLIHIFWFMYSVKNIYRISTWGGVPRDWVRMRIAYANKEHKKRPITSISAFCAIDGGVAKTLLARLGSYGWTIIMMFIMFKAHQGKLKEFRTDLFLQCVGAFGVVMIGTFSDEPGDKSDSRLMRMGHAYGVRLALFTHIGFLMQRIEDDLEYLWLPIIFIVMTFVFIVPYKLKAGKDRWKSDDPKEVTRFSMRCLILETLALSPLTLSISFFFILYDD